MFTEWPLSQGTSKAAVDQGLDRVYYEGMFTNLKGGLEAAYNQFQQEGRPAATKFILLITDGNPMYDPLVNPSAANNPSVARDEARDWAAKLKNELGVTILVVGVTNNVDRDYMQRNIATEPSFFVHVEQFEFLLDMNMNSLAKLAGACDTTSGKTSHYMLP